MLKQILVAIAVIALLPASAVAADVSCVEKSVQYRVANNKAQHPNHKAGEQGSGEPQANINENPQGVNADGENCLGMPYCG